MAAEYWKDRTDDTTQLLDELRRKGEEYRNDYERVLAIACQARKHYRKEIRQMERSDAVRFKDAIAIARENKEHWRLVAEDAKCIYRNRDDEE